RRDRRRRQGGGAPARRGRAGEAPAQHPRGDRAAGGRRPLPGARHRVSARGIAEKQAARPRARAPRLAKVEGPVTTSDIEDPRRVLARHGFSPKRAFSQNFLVDKNAVRRIAAATRAAEGSLVVELGPGAGTLTA